MRCRMRLKAVGEAGEAGNGGRGGVIVPCDCCSQTACREATLSLPYARECVLVLSRRCCAGVGGNTIVSYSLSGARSTFLRGHVWLLLRCIDLVFFASSLTFGAQIHVRVYVIVRQGCEWRRSRLSPSWTVIHARTMV